VLFAAINDVTDDPILLLIRKRRLR
jgi:hypothetical protein